MKVRHHHIASRATADEAWALAIRLGRVLVAAGITERYGMRARPVPGPRKDPAFGVYLVDRQPAEPYSVTLLFATATGKKQLLLPELVALAA